MDDIIVSFIGWTGALLCAINLIPQVYKTVQTKDVSGLSYKMLIILATAQLLLGIYGFCLREWPILTNNVINLSMTITLLYLVKNYKNIETASLDKTNLAETNL